MRTPIILCDSCGSDSVRRSKRQSLSELLRMSRGMYPFRCMDCDRRFWVSVWLFSKLPFAKCPKCLNVQLTTWPAKYFAPSLWRSIAVLLGAHRYRCMPCRHNFISFRMIQPMAAQTLAAERPTSESAPDEHASHQHAVAENAAAENVVAERAVAERELAERAVAEHAAEAGQPVLAGEANTDEKE